MRNLILSLTLSAAVFSAGCASTSGYVVKANGVEISEENKEPSKALIGLGIIAVGVALGIAITSRDGGGDAISREDQYTQCIRAGFPEPYCRSLVT